MNTIAASSAASASFGGFDQHSLGGSLLPVELGTGTNIQRQKEATEQQIVQNSATLPPTAPSVDAESSSLPNADEALSSAPLLSTPVPNQLSAGAVELPAVVLPPSNAVAAALAIVESFRIASGLDPFVDAAACATPTLHSTVHVAPSGVLPGGLAKKSLAPDPALASAVGAGNGPVTVNVYSCS